MRDGARHGLLYDVDADAQPFGDLRVGQPVELRQQEGFAHLRRQAIEQAGDLFEGLEDQVALFGRRRERLGPGGQRFEPCLFQCMAPPVAGDQPSGDRRQESARLVNDMVRALASTRTKVSWARSAASKALPSLRRSHPCSQP